ncbi:histidine phosphatase family protein [Candidatus Saccharibacteria bacterium]|nr:histidine phosphatase family protein [Candidatus Saccharibacteria bacterium]
MTKFYYVRHGESQLNIQPDIIGGRSNHVELTERGVRQAQAFGRWLSRSYMRPDHIVSSPAVRTMQTLRHSIGDVAFTTDDRLQELDQGVKTGAPRVETYNPAVRQIINEQQLDFKFDQGESIQDVMNRNMEYVDEKSAESPDDTFLIFGHGFAIRSLVGAINNLNHDEIVFGLKTPNTSLTLVETDGPHRRVKFVGIQVSDSEV